VTATTARRKASKQAREIRKRAGRLGGTVRSRAGDLGGTIRSKGGDLGGAIRSRAGRAGQGATVRTRRARRKVGYWIAGDEPKGRGTGSLILAGVAGAAAAYFLDPVSGRQRRTALGEWFTARFGRRTETLTLPETGTSMNDATLAHKVESEAFRGLTVPAGRVSVNAEFGIVTLRGTVDRPEDIAEVELRAREVAGVRDVHNLLHLSGTSAPAG
jgi:BON domain-containing protein